MINQVNLSHPEFDSEMKALRTTHNPSNLVQRAEPKPMMENEFSPVALCVLYLKNSGSEITWGRQLVKK